MSPAPYQIIYAQFDDFDQLSELVAGWNLSLHKLDAGAFRGSIFQYVSADFILSRGFFDGCLQQEGAPPPGFRTIAVPARPEVQFTWRGHTIHSDDLMVFPQGGELDAFSAPGFDVFTLSMRETALQEAIRNVDCPVLQRHIDESEVIPCRGQDMNRLRTVLHTLQQTLLHPDRQPACSHRAILDETVHTLCKAIPGGRTRALSQRRWQALVKAQRQINLYPMDPPTVDALCTEAGISKRTLEYAFREQAGIAPKAYIRAIRLNKVHRLLRDQSMPRIADAANAWGFWHMGQFAKDYFRLFGELPSETLSRPGLNPLTAPGK